MLANAFAPGGTATQLTGVPVSPVAVAAEIALSITDIAGANTLNASQTADPVAAGNSSTDLFGVSPTITGADLSVDVSGNVISAAGGIYYIQVLSTAAQTG